MTSVEPGFEAGTEVSAARRVTALLAASAMGIYVLVVVGGVTSLLDGAIACPTWPACHGRLIVPPLDSALAAAWAHRVATLLVGGVLGWTTVTVWRHGPERVRFATGITAALYPVQILLGALTATRGAPIPLSAAHLLVGMAIFSSALVALLWHLEARTPVEDAASQSDPDGYPGDPEAGSATDEMLDRSSRRDDPSDRGLRERAGDYLELTKPKLMWLLCLVAVAAMGLAAGPSLDPVTAGATLLGGVLAIGASGTFNNVFERDRDRKMDRTSDRPLVSGRIPVGNAVAFGVALAVASVAVFVALVNVLAAVLSLLAILFYSVVYTLLLKPNTSQNIVLGGAVGAFPALIGWSAVTNTVGLPAVVLGAVIFLWTPAHFYNLALAYRDDYARAGFPMLPVVRSAATTRRHILLYFGATMLGAVLLGATTRLGAVYAGTITIPSGVFLWALVEQYRKRTEAAAFRTFHASNAYLGALLVAVALDTLAI